MRTPPAALALAVFLGACSGGEPPSETSDAVAGEEAEAAQQAAPAPSTAPGTDIWLAPLNRDADGMWSVGAPQNVTARSGYDNQPFFLPDGSGFWYTAIDEAGQADIWRLDLVDRSTHRVTVTAPESEYSATALPDGSGFSVIRVEADSTQRLWRFDPDGSGAELLLPNLAPVGYQAWSGERTLVLYVLGSPATLHVVEAPTGEDRVVAENVGRSIQPMPGSTDVSFVQRLEEDTEIRRLHPATGRSTMIAPGVGEGDFHAWLPDGTLIQADGPLLLQWRPDHPMWMPLADFSALGLTISRLAANADGTLLAIVAEQG